MMAEPKFSNVATATADDDLPRTLRREREAQARRAREVEPVSTQPPAETAPKFTSATKPPNFDPAGPAVYDFDGENPAPPATITRLDMPILHLMLFFLKATIAAIPALFLLLAILWGIGELLTATFPELIKMKLVIHVPR